MSNQSTLLLTHPSCLTHDPGPGHPENPNRLATVLAALEAAELAEVATETAPAASVEHIQLAHASDYVHEICDAAPQQGNTNLDPDTVMNSSSLDATLRGAGAMIRGIDAVQEQHYESVFCAVRPPGHHAERAKAMGFCLFNGIAVGTAYALEHHQLERVAVVDFDVHHGNGTQHIFETEPRVFYASSHQMPLYPGGGAASETGVGNILNVPLAPSAGSTQMRASYKDIIFPALRKFQPQMLLVSAGFDGHHLDPLANLNLTTDDYAWLGRELKAMATELCDGKLVATLEGGYSPTALRESVPAFVEAIGSVA